MKAISFCCDHPVVSTSKLNKKLVRLKNGTKPQVQTDGYDHIESHINVNDVAMAGDGWSFTEKRSWTFG